MSEPHDLRALLRSVGGLAASGAGALTTAPTPRTEVVHAVEMLDSESAQVTAVPLPTRAFIDGVQNARVLAWQAHRPVYVTYVAAAAVGARLEVHALDERITLVCGSSDAEWLAEHAGTVPVHVLGTSDPGEIEGEAFTFLGASREEAERQVTEDLMAASDPRALVLDGTLVARPHDPRCVGVVKSVDRRYLADESVLWTLPEGWRSPRFTIPAGAGARVARYSCYLRLFPHRNRPWNFALLRLETFDPGLLDPLAARCLAERQGPGAPDARWERHLGAVRMVEEYLRSRRPPLFS